MVLGSLSVKTCDFPSSSFFFTASVSEPHQSRVDGVSEKQKKEKEKKRDTTRTPESGESYQFQCPIRVGAT